MSLGRREGWEEGVLRFRFCFSLLCSDLIGNKLNKFSQVKSVFPMTVTGE